LERNGRSIGHKAELGGSLSGEDDGREFGVTKKIKPALVRQIYGYFSDTRLHRKGRAQRYRKSKTHDQERTHRGWERLNSPFRGRNN